MHWLLRWGHFPRTALLLLSIVGLSAPTVAHAATHAPWPSPSTTSSPSSSSTTTKVDDDDDDDDKVAVDSPRASMTEFFSLTRRGLFAEASRFLDFPPSTTPAIRAQQAYRLDAVLRHYLIVDPGALSSLSNGDTNDALAQNYDEFGKVPTPDGPPDTVLLKRKNDPDDHARWVFSRPAVERIDKWYDSLADRWIRERLPARLLRPGPKGVLWWQWLAFPVVGCIALAIGRLLGQLTRIVVRWVFRRSPAFASDKHLLDGFVGPLQLAWAVGLFGLTMPSLALDKSAERFGSSLLRASILIAVFWGLVRAVDFVLELSLFSSWNRQNTVNANLVPLVGKIAKVALVILGLIEALSSLDYPVASILAGLGIGGLAIALAAQKTVENLFGALALGLDHPFHVGDFVLVDGIVGTVEALGLRSTRIRTLDRTLVTFPNAKIADMRIENFTARDRFRLSGVFRFSSATTQEQIEAAITGLRKLFNSHPLKSPDTASAFLRSTPDVLEVEYMGWYQTADWDAFQQVRQELLEQALAVIAATGAPLAKSSMVVDLIDSRAKPSLDKATTLTDPTNEPKPGT